MALWPLQGELASPRVGYVAAPATIKELVQSKKDHLRPRGAFLPGPSARRTMKFEDFLVLLNFCLLPVARLKESLWLQYGLGGPLLRTRVEGCCSKEFLVVFVVVVRGATATPRGRHILGRRRKQREFDSTRGYPGEDGD